MLAAPLRSAANTKWLTLDVRQKGGELLSTEVIVSSIGIIFGTLGLVLTIVQTYRLRRIRILTENNIWTSISSLNAVMENLDANNHEMARQGSWDLFRLLLLQAAYHETKMTERTVALWRKSGRLKTDWQEKQARLLIPTTEIKEQDIQRNSGHDNAEQHKV